MSTGASSRPHNSHIARGTRPVSLAITDSLYFRSAACISLTCPTPPPGSATVRSARRITPSIWRNFASSSTSSQGPLSSRMRRLKSGTKGVSQPEAVRVVRKSGDAWKSSATASRTGSTKSCRWVVPRARRLRLQVSRLSNLAEGPLAVYNVYADAVLNEQVTK